MLQAEVGGGGRVDSEEGLQKPGYLIRDFVLMSAQGGRVQVSDYRGRSNLVLVFAGQAGIESDFLRDAAGLYHNFTEQDAVIVAVFPYNSQETHLLKIWATLPFVALADDDGRVHSLYGAVDADGRPGPVIYVTDRFGEIVSVYDARGGKHPPSNDEVLKMLEFINHQCPECEPSEWPR
jgi:peroxiredoxin